MTDAYCTALRIEADAKALFALYDYGRLHGAVRLKWGFLDEMIPAPGVHRDEPTLFDLMREAERVQRAEDGYTQWLINEAGWIVEDGDVQAARRVCK